MREIKFRAWDVENKEMLKQDDFVVCGQGNVFRMQHSPDITGEWSSEVNLEDDREYTLMQYTGLTINGHELWEGDVVYACYSRDEFNGVIVYDTKQTRFKVCPISLYKANAGNGGWTGFGLSRVVMVLGNIYQNPELLEEQHV